MPDTTSTTITTDRISIADTRTLLSLRGDDQVRHLARTRGWTLLRAPRKQGRRVSLRRSDVQRFIDAGDNPLRDRLSMSQAARRIGHHSTAQISRLVQRGKLPALHDHGRIWFREEDLDEWLTSKRRGADAGQWIDRDEARTLLGVLGDAQVMSLAAAFGWKRKELHGRKLGFLRSEIEAFVARGENPLLDRYSLHQVVRLDDRFTVEYVSRHARTGQLPGVLLSGHWYVRLDDVNALPAKVRASRQAAKVKNGPAISRGRRRSIEQARAAKSTAAV